MLKKIIDLKNIPKSPGVYKMINQENEIIYIGKAKNLFNRVKSYSQKNLDIKTETMTSHVEKIETIVTKTEFEAILLELSLIKQHKPKYNIIEKDGKSNYYIEIEKDKEFAPIKISRKTNMKNPVAGPFVKKQQANKILQTIRPIFKIRDCNELFFKSRKRPCLEYEIGRCSAPCVGLISKEDYQKDIKKVESIFIKSDTKILEKEVKKRMNFFIEKEDYQRAKDENEKLKLLSNIKNSKDFRDLDLFCFVEKDNKIALGISIFRYGIKTETIFEFFETTNINNNFNNFIENFYKNREIPEKIIVNKSKEFLSFQHNQHS